MYDELVKRLRNCSSDTVEDCVGCPYQGGYKGTYCMNGLISEAADAIENVSEAYDKLSLHMDDLAALMPRWIPVTEEPPLKVGDDGYNGYLVFANGYYAVADYTTDEFDNAPYFYVDGEYEPRYYMPLPEPPKEET